MSPRQLYPRIPRHLRQRSTLFPILLQGIISQTPARRHPHDGSADTPFQSCESRSTFFCSERAWHDACVISTLFMFLCPLSRSAIFLTCENVSASFISHTHRGIFRWRWFLRWFSQEIYPRILYWAEQAFGEREGATYGVLQVPWRRSRSQTPWHRHNSPHFMDELRLIDRWRLIGGGGGGGAIHNVSVYRCTHTYIRPMLHQYLLGSKRRPSLELIDLTCHQPTRKVKSLSSSFCLPDWLKEIRLRSTTEKINNYIKITIIGRGTLLEEFYAIKQQCSFLLLLASRDPY